MNIYFKYFIKVGGIAVILIFTLLLTACGGDNRLPAAENSSQVSGAELYQQSCVACHGPDGKGQPNLGKDLTTSQFVQTQTDQALLAFIKQGRMPNDPGNTTGVPMPPKGGNPALTDEQILEIIAFIQTLD